MTSRSLFPLLIASALLAAAPMAASAQAKAAPAASATTQGSPSKLVLDNSQRILTTLESRRAEFTADRGKLQAFIAGEFDQMFDREYSARQVLGRHGRGADEAEVKVFADALADSLMRRYGSSLLDFNTRLRVRVKSETPLPRGLGVKDSRFPVVQVNGAGPIFGGHQVHGAARQFGLGAVGVTHLGLGLCRDRAL